VRKLAYHLSKVILSWLVQHWASGCLPGTSFPLLPDILDVNTLCGPSSCLNLKLLPAIDAAGSNAARFNVEFSDKLSSCPSNPFYFS
jgi:hypothetical protein